MANLMIANQSNYTPCSPLPNEEKKILQKVPFHEDQLFEERAQNTIWTYQDGINEFDRLEGLQPEVADWHAKLNLYEVIDFSPSWNVPHHTLLIAFFNNTYNTNGKCSSCSFSIFCTHQFESSINPQLLS